MQQSVKDIVIDEYKKCAQNPVYFFKRYGVIQHPTRGRLNFILYKFQERVLEQLMTHDYSIILKSRQMGISTLTAGYSLWMMLFHSDKNILVIATKQDVAKNLVQKVRYMYENLPSWLKVECIEDNKLNLRFANGSQIKAVSSATTSGRSEAVSMLVIDEAAFIDNIDAIWGASQQTLATGGKAIVLSTPNGIGNWFHEMWADSESGKNEKFNTIRLHWSMHPERDTSWREDQDDLLGPRLAAQECDADFITSGDTVVDAGTRKWYRETYEAPPAEKRLPSKDLWIWNTPQEGKQYIVCSDVARGDSADRSAFHVFDLEELEQVAEYDGLITTKDYGNLLVAVATEYNDALLVIENANIGWATIQQVIDRQYKNLFYTTAELKYVDMQTQYTNRFYSKDKKRVAGFTTSHKVRPLMVSKMESYFRDRLLRVKSARTLSQLDTFIYNGDNGKAEAASKYKDDLILALMIGLWVRDTALRLSSQNVQMQKLILNSFVVRTGASKMVADAVYTAPATEQQMNAQGSWRMELPNGEVENLKDWL